MTEFEGISPAQLEEHKSRILNETKNVSSFVVIGQTLHKLYYEDKLMKTQKEFLDWTKQNLGFSKSTTYEYIISYRIYSEIASKLSKEYRPPMYQSHCQLLSKVPPKKLVDTWVDVCRQAPNGVITTAFLEGYLDKHNLRTAKGRSLAGSVEPPERLGSLGPGEEKRDDFSPSRRRGSAAPSDHGGSASDETSDYDNGNVQRGRTRSDSVRRRGSLDGSGSVERNDGSTNSRTVRGASVQPSDRRSSMGRSSVGPHPQTPTRHPVAASMPHAMIQTPPHHPSTQIMTSLHATGTNPRGPASHPPRLPVNDGFIFEISRSVVLGQQFDMVMQTVEDFKAAEGQPWFGRLWCNLSAIRPFSTSPLYAAALTPPSPFHPPSFEGGLERLLQIIFTKFANKEFAEGLFLLRAEFGADWFTPILQHPYCILRHNNPPTAASPQRGGGGPVEDDGRGEGEPVPKRQKRQGGSSARQPVHPPFESYVMFYLGPNIKDFCTVFRAVGLVPGINSWWVL
ncbi:hypothetical protein HK104_002647 [Borealophlyctis nickersoniae]|nr:hypothetical protein HK104_002647 [Borealophlyctis nickersoniae]